ncbi:MAG: 4Fe-4S binding protein [Ardenticatenaceae bacterium]|nr:4Fe-4S binding protein [Ardenticatenaceae bacterium]
MKIVTMFQDVLRSLWQRPFTEKYPFEKRPSPERLRGKLHYNSEKCTGCCLCNMECPANALELITLDKKAKRFVLRYHVDRCTYCAQCVQNCRFSCLEMSPEEWELAATTKEPFAIYYGDEADVAAVLGKFTATDPEPTE